MMLLICAYAAGLVGFVLGAAWAARPTDAEEARPADPRLSMFR